MRIALGIIGFSIVFGSVPQVALAHPTLDKGVEAYEEADFDAALKAFVEAESRTDLSTDDLLKLFEFRALVLHAMGKSTEMRADLRRLASVRPTYRLSRLAPPPVRSAFDEVREKITGGVRIDLAAQALPGKLQLSAQVRLDRANIGKELSVFYRVDKGKWQQKKGERVVVLLPKGGKVDYYSTLIGPGGAIVTNVGSASSPRLADVPKKSAGGKFANTPGSVWITWGVGGGALLGAVVSGALALKRDKALDKGCGSQPEGCSASERQRVSRPALVTDILIGTGVASATVGTILFFTSRKGDKKEQPDKKKPKAKAQVGFNPWLTPNLVGGAASVSY